jgi:hypothetical protein
MLRVRSLDCQTLNIHFDLIGYGESASVRGEDHVMPGAEGREVGTRRLDVYRFTLDGYVKGTGVDRDARALSWRENTDLLLAVMDLSLAPGLVEVGPAAPAQFPEAAPYLGLTVDRFITARVVSRARGPVTSHMSHQGWSFEMECVTSPLEWQDAESP